MPRPAREPFVVQFFENVKGVKTLEYLETGLPALIAERLGQVTPLRFVGGPGTLPFDIKETKNVVKVGLNVLFGAGAGPVFAKY